MKTAVITVAGISSRFNEGIPEKEKKLKAVYTEDCRENTLLYHLLEKCSFADRIIIIGGYQFDRLEDYCRWLDPNMRDRISLIFNEHYLDLASGYSLSLGLKEALRCGAEEILFAEGDLDIDRESFDKVVASRKSVLTYTFEPIYADRAVVLYKDEKDRYRYAFNSSHGLLSIDVPFSCILNSGQLWKFTEMETLRLVNERFLDETANGTNLRIIQSYLNANIEVDLIGLKRWTNCNTKEDYRKITAYWREEK